MANQVYETADIYLIDSTHIYATPLKIFYLRMFMNEFDKMKQVEDEDEKLDVLIECVAIAMKQYCPSVSTFEAVQDNMDIKSMYKLVEIAGGISFKEPDPSEEGNSKLAQAKGASWDDMDLVRLESRAFLLGIWKDYHDLETSISMPELVAILEAKNESDYDDKKFLAAIQGVDLDKEKGQDRQDEWTQLKDKVFGKQQEKNGNDVTNLKGRNAQEAGFGIGLGLEYERL
tara:strand:+ start:7314 stop:8003 length:690 start_codon:yes stop_codon:yes gene_type:complete